MAARDQHGVEAPWGEFQVVGKANRKVDGLAKATGEAVYADDIALPGVHAVITGADLPTQYGVIPWTPTKPRSPWTRAAPTPPIT